MSDLLSELGLEEDSVRWYHLAACKNMPLNWFYDDYENDEEQAKITDQVCINCPVAFMCLQEGEQEREFSGVRGGVFLHLGKIDKQNNKHKTEAVWKELEKIHGKHLPR